MKIPYSNTTDRYVHVGGVTIPPGDTREIDAHQHPDYKPPALPEEETPVSELALILAGTVGTIVASFGALADEELAELRALEAGAAKPRASLLKAIDEAMLARAAAAAGKAEDPPAGGA